MSSRGILTALAVLGLLVCMAGCNNLTRKNFDKIHDGMTLSQVEKILGKEESGGPASTMPEATEVLTWQDKKAPRSIAVGFKDGRVVGKSATGL